ncbi:MAG: GNAT family N-acetyltransferase [Brumimicrobium sp.]
MKYGPIQHIKYLFNYNRTIIHLQADLERVSLPKDISPLYVKELESNNLVDLENWLEVINDAYDEPIRDVNYALNHINNHLFLNISNVYLIFDANEAVGTISIGTYKSNSKVGGDARIAIKKKYQGRGLGKFAISYGLAKLKERKVKYAESIITIIRVESISLHFKCGFIPQYKRRFLQYTKQRRHFLIRLYCVLKVKKLYKDFLKKQSLLFLKPQ